MKVVFNKKEIRELVRTRVDELFDGQDVEVKFSSYDDSEFVSITTKEIVDKQPLDLGKVPF